MRIYDYKEEDIEDVLAAVRNRLENLINQNPDSFEITLKYDGFMMLIKTETEQQRLLIQ